MRIEFSKWTTNKEWSVLPVTAALEIYVAMCITGVRNCARPATIRASYDT